MVGSRIGSPAVAQRLSRGFSVPGLLMADGTAHRPSGAGHLDCDGARRGVFPAEIGDEALECPGSVEFVVDGLRVIISTVEDVTQSSSPR